MAFLLSRLQMALTIVGLLASIAGIARGLPTFSVAPADTVAAKGHSVTLYCSVDDLDRNQVFWNVRRQNGDGVVIADFTLGPNYNRHESYPRLLFAGNIVSGEFNLRVEGVTAGDAGIYTCMVGGITDRAVVLESSATLSVVDAASAPASGPDCSSSTGGDLASEVHDEGETVTLTCTSPLGVPPPQLTWERVSADEFVRALESPTTSVADGIITTTSRVTLSSLDHLAYFRCTQSHPANEAVRSCRQPSTEALQVRYKPSVTLYPKVVSAEPLATRTEELRCVAHANPPLTSGPNIVIPGNKSHEVTYNGPDPGKTAVRLDITTDDVGVGIYCLAVNEMGVGRADLEIRRLSSIPAWLVMVIIGGISFVLLIFMAICCCALCVDRREEDPEPGDKVTISDWRRRQSRAATLASKKRRSRNSEPEGAEAAEEEEGDYNDGFQGDMVPIEDFQGGRESMSVSDKRGDFHSDFETGEKGPSYQNVSEAFQSDSNNSYTQSNPSSSEPILDTDFD